MKNILFFITHKTLNSEHCELTFTSISNQINNVNFFDVFYIYNTHNDELSNQTIINIYNKYNLGNYFKNYKIFDYDKNTPKTLGADIKTIIDYVSINYNKKDRILFLKSDMLLSKNYFDELNLLNRNDLVYFTSPVVNSKQRVSNNEILEYILRPRFIKSDDITFFVEDEYQSSDNDFNNRNIKITDNSIKFISCRVIRDWSCHFISIELLNNLIITSQSWGGINLQNLEKYLVKTNNCFTLHKYHNIVSDNRSSIREGPVETWLTS